MNQALLFAGHQVQVPATGTARTASTDIIAAECRKMANRINQHGRSTGTEEETTSSQMGHSKGCGVRKDHGTSRHNDLKIPKKK
jgi:hypothetical protein